ncbi:MAG: hypothetical protein R2830_25010 [Saprospiraceae bacterium]
MRLPAIPPLKLFVEICLPLVCDEGKGKTRHTKQTTKMVLKK